jgi:hypothetical protein
MVRFDPLQKWAPRRRNAAIGGYETPSNSFVLVNELLDQHGLVVFVTHTTSLALIALLCMPFHWLPHRTHTKRPQRFIQLV